MGCYETCFVEHLYTVIPPKGQMSLSQECGMHVLQYELVNIEHLGHFLSTCVGKKVENIGMQSLSTPPQTCCSLITRHYSSSDRWFTYKSASNNNWAGCRCPRLSLLLGPKKKKQRKRKRVVPLLFIIIPFF